MASAQTPETNPRIDAPMTQYNTSGVIKEIIKPSPAQQQGAGTRALI